MHRSLRDDLDVGAAVTYVEWARAVAVGVRLLGPTARFGALVLSFAHALRGIARRLQLRRQTEPERDCDEHAPLHRDARAAKPKRAQARETVHARHGRSRVIYASTIEARHAVPYKRLAANRARSALNPSWYRPVQVTAPR